MSDNLRIGNFLSHIKGCVLGQSCGSYNPWAAIRKDGQQKNKQQNNEHNYYVNPANDKLFNLGEMLGLTKEEVNKAIELITKATSQHDQKTDVSSIILSNELIKYPAEEEFISLIPEKALPDIEKEFPDLYMAITNPFEFMCNHPKTITAERYKKFTYAEILQFSEKCPDEYNILKEATRPEYNDEAT